MGHTAAGIEIPPLEDVLSHYESNKTAHPFLQYEERHKFADAAKSGNWDIVEETLKIHPDWINFTRPLLGAKGSGYTPLHQAAYVGSLAACKMLLSRGANRTRTCVDGTALDIAKSRGFQQIVDLLT